MAPSKYITVTGIINNPLDTCVYSLDESEVEELSKVHEMERVEAVEPHQAKDYHKVKMCPLVIINLLAGMGYRVESCSKDTNGGGMWILVKKEPEEVKVSYEYVKVFKSSVNARRCEVSAPSGANVFRVDPDMRRSCDLSCLDVVFRLGRLGYRVVQHLYNVNSGRDEWLLEKMSSS